jgi:hypothetical protein
MLRIIFGESSPGKLSDTNEVEFLSHWSEEEEREGANMD